MRFETIIDDGVTMATEWTSVPTDRGSAIGARSQAGFAAYERDADGYLCSVRINDNIGEWDWQPRA